MGNKSRVKHFLKRREEDVAYERGIEAHGNMPRKIEANTKQSQTDRIKYTGGDRRRSRIIRDPIAKGVSAGRPVRTGNGIKRGGRLAQKANPWLRTGSQVRSSNGMSTTVRGIQGGTRSTGGMRSSVGLR